MLNEDKQPTLCRLFCFILVCMKKVYLLLSLLVLSIFVSAQIQDSIAVSEGPPLKETKTILTDRIDRMPVRLMNTKTLDWSWENLGPNIQPKEHRPGGRAIPKYAENRGNGTGRINYLYLHPRRKNLIWACSPTGGMWWSNNNGESWTVAGTDKLAVSGVSSVAVDPKKWQRWWIATGDGDDVFQYTDGVWLSPNAGKTYISMNGKIDGKKLPFGSPDDIKGQISEIKLHPRNRSILYAATNRGLYVASDAMNPEWIEWNRISDKQFYDIQTIRGRSKSKDVIIASGEELWISKNGGVEWKSYRAPTADHRKDFPFVRMKTLRSNDMLNEIYIVVTCSKAHTMSTTGEADLYLFNFETEKWTYLRSLKDGMNNMIPTRARAIATNPNDRSVLLCGNVQPLFHSTNGGKDFKKIEKNQMHDDCHHILFTLDGKTVFAGHDGGVSKSQDGGLTWKASDLGIGAANVFGLAVAQTQEPQVLYGGYDTGGNLLLNNEWKHVSWGDGFECIIHPKKKEVMFSTMQNGNLLRTTDGDSFDGGKNPNGARTEWHTWIRMHPVYHQMVFCGGEKLMRSRDTGDTWEPILDVKKIGTDAYNVYRFYLSEDHPNVLYAYVLDSTRIRPQIWRTQNITETNPELIKWERLPALPVEGWLMSIIIDPENPLLFSVLLNRSELDGKFLRYNGSSYMDETANLGYSKCEAMVLQRGPERRIYLGSNYGVFTKRWNESQWTLLKGLPGTQIKSLDINYVARKLVVGTYGRGVWWGELVR